MLPSEAHKRQLFVSPVKIMPTDNSSNEKGLDQVSSLICHFEMYHQMKKKFSLLNSELIKITLLQDFEESVTLPTNNVPTSLKSAIVHKNTVEELSKFLRSRGIPPRGLKHELVLM